MPVCPPLPQGARLVHIGPHKTGSTAIQVALQEAGDTLERYDAFYATGPRHRPDRAGWALGLKGRPAGSEQPPIERWHALTRKVADAGERRVCISNEDFGRATAEQVRTIVDELGGDRVHVVAVARRLDRYLPSQWQERVKAGDRRSFEDWLRVVLDRDSDDYDWDRENVWFSHDLGRLVPRWVEVLGPERFTLIVSDETDRTLLPYTFEDLLGLPQETLRPNAARSNRGLSWGETELVRAINVQAAERGWTRAQRRPFLKQGVLRDMQTRATPPGPKNPPFPDWAIDTVRRLGDERAEQIATLGVRVVGDAESMRIPADVPVVSGPVELPTVSAETAAAAVTAAMQVSLGEGSGDDGAQQD
jgi:hypothetical protein